MIPRKKPDRIIRAGGREFRLYNEYDQVSEEYVLQYPDFNENPEYTAEGWPFAMAAQESCPEGDSGDLDNPDPYECNGCVWYRMDAPDGAIGVCMCDKLRRKPVGNDE